MGFFIRKSFKAGPVRINLSKSGVGVSTGVKGARIGVGPRGSYVHAGRNGLYYRQNLSSPSGRSKPEADGSGCAILLLGIIALGCVLAIISWLANNPFVFWLACIFGGVFIFFKWKVNAENNKRLDEYKGLLDAVFIKKRLPPSEKELKSIRNKKKKLADNPKVQMKVKEIDENVYQAILDKCLDDGLVSEEEAGLISVAEKLLSLTPSLKLRVKKEIFSSAYLQAIEDRKITKEELGKIKNLLKGLALPQSEVRQELSVLEEFVDAQQISTPLRSMPREQLKIPLKKNETGFYQDDAQVLVRRKSKVSPSGFEYALKRDGVMIITDKRIMIFDQGTTNIPISEIGDFDVDIDEGLIEVFKTTSSKPMTIKTKSPIIVGRYLDLLTTAGGSGNIS